MQAEHLHSALADYPSSVAFPFVAASVALPSVAASAAFPFVAAFVVAFESLIYVFLTKNFVKSLIKAFSHEQYLTLCLKMQPRAKQIGHYGV